MSAYIVGDWKFHGIPIWNTITLHLKEKKTIADLKTLMKAQQGLNCSTHQMKVYYYGNPDLHVGKRSFICNYDSYSINNLVAQPSQLFIREKL